MGINGSSGKTDKFGTVNLNHQKILTQNIRTTGLVDRTKPINAAPSIGMRNKDIAQNQTKTLPVIFNANIQSFGSSEQNDKTLECEVILKMNNVQIATFTETWLSEKHAERIPFHEYQKFHLIRKNTNRRSGGVSVLIHNNLQATELKIKVPEHLEVKWVTVRPNWLPRAISSIIVCGVYYPGSGSAYAPPVEDLIFHISTSVQYLKRKYVNPLFLVMGDFNDLPIESICSVCDFKQEVKVPTRGDKTLDLIMTNKNNEFYEEPITLPKIGDADHLPVLYIPKEYIAPKTLKKTIEIRKMPNSGIKGSGTWISSCDWKELAEIEDPNEAVKHFSTTTWSMVNRYFPLSKVVIANTDKEWITPKIKELISEKQKAHFKKCFYERDSLAKKLKKEIKMPKRSSTSPKLTFL